MIFIDDYHYRNIELARKIKSYGLERKTWFAIQLNTLDSENQIVGLHKKGFNIASHTVTHAHLNRISLEDAEWEMKESKRILEDLVGKIEWLVTPRGRSNSKVDELAFKLGYKYIRTTKIYNENERILGGCHLTYPRKEYNGIDPFDYAKQNDFKIYWGHTNEIIKFNLWDKFDEFLKWYKEKYENIHRGL